MYKYKIDLGAWEGGTEVVLENEKKINKKELISMIAEASIHFKKETEKLSEDDLIIAIYTDNKLPAMFENLEYTYPFVVKYLIEKYGFKRPKVKYEAVVSFDWWTDLFAETEGDDSIVKDDTDNLKKKIKEEINESK